MLTDASIALKARRRAKPYPFTLENLEDPAWWQRMPEPVRLMNRDVARRYVQKMQDDEESNRQFIALVGARQNIRDSDRIDFSYLATNEPDALTIHVPEDNSYAIALDQTMSVFFDYVFSSLLDACYLRHKNLTWVEPMLDFVLKSIARQESLRIDQKILSRQRLEIAALETFKELARSMAEQFLILHELAHIALDHTNKRAALAVASGNARDALAKFDQDAEYEADDWAANVLWQSAVDDAVKRPLAAYIPALYFGLFALARQLYFPRDVLGEALRDAHPNPWGRAQRLKRQVVHGSSSPVAPVLADALSRVEREWRNPSFKVAAWRLRRRLEKAPPHPEELEKRVPFEDRMRAFEADLIWAKVRRRLLGYANLMFYGAIGMMLLSRRDQLSNYAPALATLAVVLVIACFYVASASKQRRWHAQAYAESLSLPARAIYIGQLTLLLNVSAFGFGLSAFVLAVMYRMGG
jgi:hypothetical protein